MEKEMTAFMPEHIRAFLRSGKAGEIILVSSSGIYLKFEEQIFLLCDKRWGVLPIGIGVADFDLAVSLLRPQQGQRVAVLDDRLVFPSGSLCLAPQDLEGESACPALPKLQQIRQAAEELAMVGKTRGISMLVRPMVLGLELRDGLQQNPYCAQAYRYLAKLIELLRQNEPESIRTCVEKLLGLGPGLTPSADDVMLGMLFVFRALPDKNTEAIQWFSECVGQLCHRCTNQISAAYLKAMMAGAPFERMELIFREMCGEKPMDIQKLTQIGSSSGSEMLLGMLLALGVCGYDVSQKEELQ